MNSYVKRGLAANSTIVDSPLSCPNNKCIEWVENSKQLVTGRLHHLKKGKIT